MNEPAVVTVRIAGDEYALRAHATSEYTRDCAAHVDRTISEILKGGTLVDGHKAAILAALAITDQLFQARREAERMRTAEAQRAAELAARLEARLSAPDLAGPS